MSASEVIGRLERSDAQKTKPAGHIPGEAGIWVLLFGDMMVFTVLFGVYLNSRGASPELFASSQNALNRNFGAINTLVLLTSSLLVAIAVRAYRDPRRRRLATPLLLAGFAVGCCFVVIKLIEYHEKVSMGINPTTNEFFMYYFVLTGLHL